MKIIQQIKDYFAPAYSVQYANPTEDVKTLSSLCGEKIYLTARNGKNYFYFFPYNEYDVTVAKYLFVRNGIPMRIHTSVYHYKKEKALRIPRAFLDANPDKKDFVEDINRYNPDNIIPEEKLLQRVKVARRQMQGHAR